MLDSRDIGGLQGAPVQGPDNEKIGNVHQVFVDAVTGAPNWITLKTGFLGRHEIFAPLANATWDGEIVHTEHGKEALLAAPRLNADEGLSPHNEEALNRHFGISDVDTDGGTARPADEYPERPDLMDRAAAQEREEQAAMDSPSEDHDNSMSDDRTVDDTRSEDANHEVRDTDDDLARAHDADADHDGRGSDDKTLLMRDGTNSATNGQDDGPHSSGSPLAAAAAETDSGSDRNSTGPRHAKPNPAL